MKSLNYKGSTAHVSAAVTTISDSAPPAQTRTIAVIPVAASPRGSYPGIQRTTTVGIRVDAIDDLASVHAQMVEALERPSQLLVTFANPASAIIARRKTDLVAALTHFDVVAPDGIGMVLAMRMLHRTTRSARISFDSTSLAPHLFRLAVERQATVVLIGGTPGVAGTARARISEAYQGIKIIGTFSGFDPVDETVAAIRQLAPAIVVVGMGALLQESFLLTLAGAGWSGLGFTCGGYLDQLANKGTKYYPRWVDGLEIRWAYRLMMEPRRLWRRYLLQYPEFGFCLFGDLLRSRGVRIVGAKRRSSC